MKCVFIMCPLDQVVVDKDTSYALMLGARKRGHQVYHVKDGDLSLANDKVFFHALSVTPKEDRLKPFEIEDEIVLAGSDVDVVFIRTDPPFDESYLHTTWILENLPPKVIVMNRPSGIRDVNEKIWVTKYPDLIPPTLITKNKREYLEFIEIYKEIIVKPTNGFGGASVFKLTEADSNKSVVFETLTKQGKEHVVIQRYLPESQEGDKRILLLNACPMGSVLRVHSEEDHRNNFFAGGKPEKTALNERDYEIIEKIRPELRDLGLYFVGIDVIGGFLVEVNVTSPTGIQEINRLENKHLEDDVIAFAEDLVRSQTKV